MADKFLVTSYIYKFYDTLVEAEEGREKLVMKCPAKTFRILRTKTHLSSNGGWEKLKAERDSLWLENQQLRQKLGIEPSFQSIDGIY